jgi:hypothetical protein
MQANIVRVNHSHLEFEKRVKNHPQVVTTSFGSHFALEIKTESTATYYGTLRNKLYDFFYRKRSNFATCREYCLYFTSLFTEQQLQKSISSSRRSP